ncbi:uncharacterized protein CLUP02_02726 [Colletotrichum lupini]|uniref:Uncharacterized protein n=1 Tax=Colletotrichum lupini TaxID=145971 RepID=A0A9Q8WBJ1_9PEZI|nr:uncharacterized protein CLUP02_02726 [Colletotrichum lupini]UQC77259.1 hypothetical protein CLUP02_02726 [Colletotrichum lupini]
MFFLPARATLETVKTPSLSSRAKSSLRVALRSFRLRNLSIIAAMRQLAWALHPIFPGENEVTARPPLANSKQSLDTIPYVRRASIHVPEPWAEETETNSHEHERQARSREIIDLISICFTRLITLGLLYLPRHGLRCSKIQVKPRADGDQRFQPLNLEILIASKPFHVFPRFSFSNMTFPPRILLNLRREIASL